MNLGIYMCMNIMYMQILDSINVCRNNTTLTNLHEYNKFLLFIYLQKIERDHNVILYISLELSWAFMGLYIQKPNYTFCIDGVRTELCIKKKIWRNVKK